MRTVLRSSPKADDSTKHIGVGVGPRAIYGRVRPPVIDADGARGLWVSASV